MSFLVRLAEPKSSQINSEDDPPLPPLPPPLLNRGLLIWILFLPLISKIHPTFYVKNNDHKRKDTSKPGKTFISYNVVSVHQIKRVGIL